MTFNPLAPGHPSLALPRSVASGDVEKTRGTHQPASFSEAATESPRANTGRSPLADILPTFETVGGWFRAIDFDGYTVPSGQDAWYGLQSIKSQRNNDQEIWLAGLSAEMLPPDVDGAGGGGALAWGTTGGLGATLVVGRDLGIRANEWTYRASNHAGMSNNPNTTSSGYGVLWSSTFPTGKFTDATANKMTIARNFAPLLHRIPAGSSLDIALVLHPTALSGNTGTVYGYAGVQCVVGLTSPRGPWAG